MKILNIEFVPFNEPLRNRLQTLTVTIWFITVSFGFLIWIPLLYVFFTQFWWVTLFLVSCMYLDRNTPQQGGRSVNWMLKHRIWYHLRDYFPTSVIYETQFTLNTNRNYLFCCFPHGIIPAGPFTNLVVKTSDFHKRYPQFEVKAAITDTQFYIPLIREINLALGTISCSAKSLNYILNKPEGGHIISLMPGGVRESQNSQPGRYKFVLKRRKGFIRIALQNGCPLVPVITFGETDLFHQYKVPLLRPFQDLVRKYLGVTPLIINGRGFFQYNFGIIPRQKPLNTVFGKPINVEKVEKPTEEQIDDVHKKFVEHLVQLFEDYKYEFLEDPENTHLELE